jgi:hypothetical protein
MKNGSNDFNKLRSQTIESHIHLFRQEARRGEFLYSRCCYAGKECNGWDDCIVMHDSPPCLKFAEDNKKLAAWISKKYKTETMAKWRRRKQNG